MRGSPVTRTARDRESTTSAFLSCSARVPPGRTRIGVIPPPPPGLAPTRPAAPRPPARPDPSERSGGARAAPAPIAAATGECQPRGGGRRSHCFSLNFMASVHYYTVRIFIWTAKLKTDFCQNCRYHKKRMLPALGARRAAEPGPPPPSGPPRRPEPLPGPPGVEGGCGGPVCAGRPRVRRCPPSGRRGGSGWQRAPVHRGLPSRPLPQRGLPGFIGEELKQGHLCLESLRSSKPANACWHGPPSKCLVLRNAAQPGSPAGKTRHGSVPRVSPPSPRPPPHTPACPLPVSPERTPPPRGNGHTDV